MGLDPLLDEEGEKQHAMKWGDLNLVDMRRKWHKVEVGCLSLSQRLKLLVVEQCGNSSDKERCVVTGTEFVAN